MLLLKTNASEVQRNRQTNQRTDTNNERESYKRRFTGPNDVVKRASLHEERVASYEMEGTVSMEGKEAKSEINTLDYY